MTDKKDFVFKGHWILCIDGPPAVFNFGVVSSLVSSVLRFWVLGLFSGFVVTATSGAHKVLSKSSPNSS